MSRVHEHLCSNKIFKNLPESSTWSHWHNLRKLRDLFHLLFHILSRFQHFTRLKETQFWETSQFCLEKGCLNRHENIPFENNQKILSLINMKWTWHFLSKIVNKIFTAKAKFSSRWKMAAENFSWNESGRKFDFKRNLLKWRRAKNRLKKLVEFVLLFL